MILSLSFQAKLFLLTASAGFFAGISYDILRITRLAVRRPTLFSQIEDFIFWLVAAFFGFLFMLRASSGEIRLYSVAGIFLGMLLYFSSLSPFVIKISERLIFLCKFIVRLIFEIISTPFRLLWALFSPFLLRISGFFKRILKKILQLCKVYVKINKMRLLREMRTALKKR